MFTSEAGSQLECSCQSEGLIGNVLLGRQSARSASKSRWRSGRSPVGIGSER